MKEYESLKTLDKFIEYLETTQEDEWSVDVVRSKDGKKDCVMGHLVNWYYGKGDKGNIMPIWDAFESMWATTYMIYPVNDGEAPKWMNYEYKQRSAKERVTAYLKNLNEGKEKNTEQLWNESTEEKLTKLIPSLSSIK